MNQHRTEKDLIDILNGCLRSNRLPGGEKLSRANFRKWLQVNEFYHASGRRIINGERLYARWNKSLKSGSALNSTKDNIYSEKKENVPYSAFKSTNEIDPSINILDEDFEFEEGDNVRIEPYIFPTGDHKILLLNDIHIPYHSLEAVRAAINYGREEQVNAVILNGDIMDLYQMSRFSKIPNKKTIRDELELCRQFLQQLRKLFPSEKIIFKVGNHDYRLSRYIHERAPELFGVDAINLPELLKLREYNIDFVQSSQGIQIGDLLCCHGHEWGGGGGINAARSILLKANCNVIVGHFHRSQEYITTRATGGTMGCWAVGCLCDLSPEYLAFNNWNNGAAIIHTFADGSFRVNNFKIINGKVY